jgi:hypothetical protein
MTTPYIANEEDYRKYPAMATPRLRSYVRGPDLRYPHALGAAE